MAHVMNSNTTSGFGLWTLMPARGRYIILTPIQVAHLNGFVVTLEARVEGHAPLSVRLRVEEDFGMHDVVGMCPALVYAA